MAGFFDGEGYVGVLKRQRGKYIEHFVQVSIGQRDGEVMDWIVTNYGGFIHKVKRDGSFQWIASNGVAYRFLKSIYPYLKYKKPQARMAISFFEDKPNTRNVGESELKRRDKIMQDLKLQKKYFFQSTLCK